MTEFNPQLIALKLALKKMFSDGWFDICTINSLLKLTGSIPDSETLKIMQSVHCVKYADMPEDFRQWLFEESILMFQKNGFNFNKFEVLDNNIAPLYLKN